MWNLTQRTFVGSEGGFARPATIARLLAVGVLVVAALGSVHEAPSSSSTHTVTITASGPTSGSSSASSSSASSATSSQPATPMTKFSGNCYALLTLYDVQRAAGYTIGGKTAFIVGIPDKTAWALELPELSVRPFRPLRRGRSATPQIEINVALYSTPAQAQKRAASTVSDYVANGATATQVTIRDVPGRS